MAESYVDITLGQQGTNLKNYLITIHDKSKHDNVLQSTVEMLMACQCRKNELQYNLETIVNLQVGQT